MSAIARRRGGAPFVVRAHEHLPPTTVGRAVRSVLVRTASAVVANSDYTASRFNEGLAAPVATRVYNSIDHARFDPDRVRPAGLREQLGLAPERQAARPGGADHPLEGPGHRDPGAGRAASRGPRRTPRCSSGRSPFPARGCATTTTPSCARCTGWSSELARRRRGPLPRPARRRAGDPAASSTCRCCPRGRSRSGWSTVESMALRHSAARERASAPGPSWCEDGVSGRVLPPKRPDSLGRRPRASCSSDRERLAAPGRGRTRPRPRASATRSTLARCSRSTSARSRDRGRPARRRARGGQRTRGPGGGTVAELIWRLRGVAARARGAARRPLVGPGRRRCRGPRSRLAR